MALVELRERLAIRVRQRIDAGNHELGDLAHVGVVVVLALVAASVHRQIDCRCERTVRCDEEIVVRLTPRLAHIQEPTLIEG